MAYGTLMVYVGLGRSNVELLQVAGDLAVRFQAGVIGIAARQPATIAVGNGFVFWSPIISYREAVPSDIEKAEAEFRGTLMPRVESLEWRSAAMCASIADYLAHEVLSADVLIIDIAADVFNSSWQVNACDLAMLLGRPVVIVPTATQRADGGRDKRSVRSTAPEGQQASEVPATFDRAPRMDIAQMVARVG